MSVVRFISDLHFGHDRLIQKLRNMDPIEHNELIVSNWNSVVRKDDITYIVGDLSMEKLDPVMEYLPKLKGRKIVIPGNHDSRKVISYLHDIGVEVKGPMSYKGFIVTHIPVHPNEVKFFRGNIHGHVHANSYEDPRYYNISCDVINYTPKLFSEIEMEFMIKKLRSWQP